MAAQWPLVVSRLVEFLPTLPGWDQVTVCDGAAFDVKTALYNTVGHATDGVNTQAGNYTKTLTGEGSQYAESGSVVCQLGIGMDGDLSALRSTLFSLFDQLEAAIRADRRLGVLSQEGTCDLTVDLSSAQMIAGVSYAITWSLDYFTVTT
jgi:hypothetical protein